MKQRRAIRKIVIRASIFLMLFLAAGAIVNIAVAWGFAAWGSYTHDLRKFYSHEGKPRWRVGLSFGVGTTCVSFIPDIEHWGGDVSPGKPVIPAWSRVASPPTDEVVEDATHPWWQEKAFGWPMRSAYATLCNRKPARMWQVDAGLEIPGNAGWPLAPVPRVHPIQAIYEGFAINTLFYAAILWLLFAIPIALRRMRRIKRGLCPACAYPVGVSPVCTECGKPVNPRPRKASNGEPAPSS